MTDYAHKDTSEKECLHNIIFEAVCFVLFCFIAPVVAYAVYIDC